MNRAFEKLQPHLERIMALNTAMTLFNWDTDTLAPKEAGPYTAKVIGTLSDEYFQALVNDEVKALVKECQEHGEGLDENQAAIVKEAARTIEELEVIPKEEYREFSELQSEAAAIWSRAREDKDYEAFAPTLEKLIAFTKKFAGYQAKDGQKIYDVLLDQYERGFDMESLDRFFSQVRDEIVPLLKQVVEKNDTIDSSFLTEYYEPEKQEEFGRFLAEYCGFEFDKGVLATSAHPFTTNLHNHDVRITTRYVENKLDSSLFSIIHETGHALYELGISDEITQTLVGGGASMGMHESQSRFYENIIGRSEAFWEPIYGKLVETFPKQLEKVSLDQFIKAVNKAVPGLIRIDADELTYCLHIMVRYEMEKMIMDGSADVKDLPKLWNEKYQEYLGVSPEDDAEGVLQDIHWAQGSFGYFPSYALGSAFAAQFYHKMQEELDVEGLLKEGNLKPIREFLKDRIHRYGKVKETRDLIKAVTGEDFTPKYYIEYLKEKYKKIYSLA